jgi:hypothetical protein
MQLHIEKYFEGKETNPNESTNSLSILKQYLSKIMSYHNPQTTTTKTNLSSVVSMNPQISATYDNESNIIIDQQLEQVLAEIEQSSNQSLNEMNNLFNEVDVRRKRREIPEYLTCKLCYDLMRDPVITPCKSRCQRKEYF